jgi:hypothetical protein
VDDSETIPQTARERHRWSDVPQLSDGRQPRRTSHSVRFGGLGTFLDPCHGLRGEEALVNVRMDREANARVERWRQRASQRPVRHFFDLGKKRSSSLRLGTRRGRFKDDSQGRSRRPPVVAGSRNCRTLGISHALRKGV